MMVRCPMCGALISSRSSECPNCHARGVDFRAELDLRVEETAWTRFAITGLVLMVLAIMALVMAGVWACLTGPC